MATRTRKDSPTSVQGSARSRCCRSPAAAAASPAAGNTAKNESPTVLKTRPLRASIVPRSMRSCCASAPRIRSGNFSHNVVLPSMSVNRKIEFCILAVRARHYIISHRQIVQRLYNPPVKSLILRGSARTGGGKAVIGREDGVTRNPVENTLRETEVAQCDGSITLDHKYGGDVMKAVCR